MKVLFDHQLFSFQRIGGASKYFCELLANMPREMWETTTIWSNNRYVEDLNLFPHKSFMPNRYFRGQGRIMSELNWPHTKKVISQGNYDVYHQTHFYTNGFKALGNKPMVTTFHDINFSTLVKNDNIVRLQKLSLERADKIITISQNTKKDMLRLFDIDENKISVIYHGVEQVDLKELSTEQNLYDFPYLLYVGTRAPNKNWHRFMQAFSVIAAKYKDLKLVCTGKDFSDREKEFINSLGLTGKVVHIQATERQMQILYFNSVAFVFPSLYEGFGMPLLEAMVCKCPVICANSSCFPEIAQNAVEYFEPESVESMIASIQKVLSDNEYRKELGEKGYNHSHNFSWKKSAEEHIAVYQSLI